VAAPRGLDAAAVARIVGGYERGESVRQIARALGINSGTVSYHLRRAGVAIRPTSQPRGGGRPWCVPPGSAAADDLARRYLAGTSAKRLAADAGVAPSTMRRLLATHGVRLRDLREAAALSAVRTRKDAPCPT
jgi:transposase-like protein